MTSLEQSLIQDLNTGLEIRTSEQVNYINDGIRYGNVDPKPEDPKTGKTLLTRTSDLLTRVKNATPLEYHPPMNILNWILWRLMAVILENMYNVVADASLQSMINTLLLSTHKRLGANSLMKNMEPETLKRIAQLSLRHEHFKAHLS